LKILRGLCAFAVKKKYQIQKTTAEPQRTQSFFLKILRGLCAFAVQKN